MWHLPADRDLLVQLAALAESELPELLSIADAVRAMHCGDGVAVEVSKCETRRLLGGLQLLFPERALR